VIYKGVQLRRTKASAISPRSPGNSGHLPRISLTLHPGYTRLVAAALKDGGPSLIAARIDGEPAVATTDRDPVRIRANFMQGISQV
jgi:hypothetical protein